MVTVVETRRHALGRLPTPPPLPENLLLRLHRKLPSAPLASSQEVRNPKIGQQLGAQPTPRSINASTNASTNASINASIIPLNPLHALHFLLPTGDSRSGRRSFDSKLNLPSPARRGSRSRPPLRRPRPLRFERLRVPVWNPYSRDLNLIEEFKFKLQRRDNLLRLAPQLAATPWGGFPPRPLCQKICYSDCTENCPLRPLRAPRRFGIRKSASNSGHSPLRGSGGCSMHCSMHYSMHYSMHCSMQCSTHCRPSLFAAHRR